MLACIMYDDWIPNQLSALSAGKARTESVSHCPVDGFFKGGGVRSIEYLWESLAVS